MTLRSAHVLLATLSGALFLTACSESRTLPAEVDAAIVIDVDARIFMDAGTDAGPPSNVGSECGVDEDCVISGETGACIEDPDLFPGGYCSGACSDAASCPDGSACVNFGRGQQFCVASCDPTVTTRQCRAGYGCSTNPMLSGLCLGGCFDDTDCASGLRCDRAGGLAGACFDPTSSIGAACEEDTSCPMGTSCLAERFIGWPGGACASFECDVPGDTGCGAGATCVPASGVGFGVTSMCLASCTSDGECRDGWACRAVDGYPERRVCRPACDSASDCSGGRVCNPALGICASPFDASQLGAMCSRRGGCTGGSCLREADSGFPGAYCAYFGCTVGTDSTCPTGGACAPTADGAGICLDACAADADCTRPGYACRNVDGANPMSSRACLPACTSDMHCANMGFVCNVGTGRCTAPFVASALGEPCAGASECVGGTCLSEAGSGWPAGTCTYPGCGLMGGGATCPTGGVCVDDLAGDPAIGRCVDACTVGAMTGCRPGYACVALTMGGTEGACQPACTAASCSGGRTCNPMTMLCE